MKNKKIIICVIFVILLSISTIFLVNKNNKKYIMKDGIMLALTLDGESITEFPDETNYRIEIECENGIGKWLPEEWKFVVEDIIGNVKCNLDFTTRTDSDKLKSMIESGEVAAQRGLTNNSGELEISYRYTGRKPNNYIWFNNEMWRIIGSVPVCLNSDCSNKENLVKIIRNQSIGGLAFSSTSTNSVWGTNTLYTLLNKYYYGKLDATGASPCLGYSSIGYALCNYSVIGISSNENDFYGSMIKDVYWNIGTVGSTSITVGETYKLETSTLSSVSGKIGLMNISDYSFGVSNGTYDFSNLGSYEEINWLYSQGYEWTITPYNSYFLFGVNYDGSAISIRPSQGNSIRPVVYLDSNVYIVSGDGSITNPYQIGM